jgi:lipopolysaccharide biosynthesis glycosyltransferase
MTNLLHSSSNKLKIYLFDKINDYDKIIYCDLDIIWLKNPNNIFNLIKTNEIYLTNENVLMSEDFWGGKLLTQEEKQLISKENIKGLNAGIFAFNHNMIKEFQKIDVFFDSNVSLANECLEQPFINTYVFRNKIYNTQMNEFVSHNGYNLKDYDGVLLHFAGGPGNYSIKYDKMKNFYETKYDDNI